MESELEIRRCVRAAAGAEEACDTNLAVGCAVGLDDPPRLVAERLEDLVVVAVLGEVVVAVGPEAGVDLGRDRPAPALPPAAAVGGEESS